VVRTAGQHVRSMLVSALGHGLQSRDMAWTTCNSENNFLHWTPKAGASEKSVRRKVEIKGKGKCPQQS
jgi:hypothetical protein